MSKKQITTELLQKNGFCVYQMGEYYRGIYSFESNDKLIETDLDFWINIKNPDDVQMRIHKIDKTIKKKHVCRTLLDTPIIDIKQVKMFLKAFNIENNLI